MFQKKSSETISSKQFLLKQLVFGRRGTVGDFERLILLASKKSDQPARTLN
jgi:hypothetical protein